MKLCFSLLQLIGKKRNDLLFNPPFPIPEGNKFMGHEVVHKY